jgi:hypothetical protein
VTKEEGETVVGCDMPGNQISFAQSVPLGGNAVPGKA